jgi:hypothetical protein
VAGAERLVDLLRAEQTFVLNMFLIWEGVHQHKTSSGGNYNGPSSTPPPPPAAAVDVSAVLASCCGHLAHPLVELAAELGLEDFDSSPFRNLEVDGDGNIVGGFVTSPSVAIKSNFGVLSPRSAATPTRAQPEGSPSGRARVTLASRSATPALTASQEAALARGLTTLFKPFVKALGALAVQGAQQDRVAALAMIIACEAAVDAATPLPVREAREAAAKQAHREHVRQERQRVRQELEAAGAKARGDDLGLSSDSDDDERLRTAPADSAAASAAALRAQEDAQVLATIARLRETHLPAPLAKGVFFLPFTPASRAALTPAPKLQASVQRQRSALSASYAAHTYLAESSLQGSFGVPQAVAALTTVLAQLKVAWNGFVGECEGWVASQRVNAKQGGVLGPVARLPGFIEKLEAICYPHRSAAADTAYTKLLLAVMRWVQTAAAANTKYQQVVLMENFHFLCNALASRRPRLPQVQASLLRAKQVYYQARQRYTGWSIAYQVPALTSFWNLLFLELKQRRAHPPEVALLSGLTKNDLRAVLASHFSVKALEAAVRGMLKRLTRHLPHNPDLVRDMLLLIREQFLGQCAAFLRALELVYVHQQVDTSLNDVHEIFDRVMSLGEVDKALQRANDGELSVSETAGGRVGASVTRATDVESIVREQADLGSKFGHRGQVGAAADLPGEMSDLSDTDDEDEDDDGELLELEVSDGEEMELEVDDDDDDEGPYGAHFTSYAAPQPAKSPVNATAKAAAAKPAPTPAPAPAAAAATASAVSPPASVAAPAAPRPAAGADRPLTASERRAQGLAVGSRRGGGEAAPAQALPAAFTSGRVSAAEAAAAAAPAKSPSPPPVAEAPAPAARSSPPPQQQQTKAAAKPAPAPAPESESDSMDLPPALDDDDSDDSEETVSFTRRPVSRAPAPQRSPSPAAATSKRSQPDSESDSDSEEVGFGAAFRKKPASKPVSPPSDDDDSEDEQDLGGFRRR